MPKPPKSIAASLGLSLALLMSATPSCDDSTACTQREDCFKAQTCFQGQCTPLSEVNNLTPSANNTNGTNNANNETPDATQDQTKPPEDACIVTVPAICQDDPQEKDGTFAFAITPAQNRYVGCLGLSDTEIVALPETTLQATLCDHDSRGDWYMIEYSRCRSVSYRIELRVELKTPCDPEQIEVTFNADCDVDQSCVQDNPSPGVYTHTSIIRTVSSPIPTNTIPIMIRAKRPDIKLDYEVYAHVTQEP